MRHEESKIQTACVTWFRITPKYRKVYNLLFSIPNGAKLAGNQQQRARQGKRLKSEGLVPGVADLFLAIPSGDLCGLFIEMKTKKGRQQDSQKAFERSVIEAGYGYVICRSLEDFQNAVLEYLNNGNY
jgi:hypothetical protein